jgi:hypothetical protein
MPPAAQGLSKVNHIIVVMMENHSLTTTSERFRMFPGARITAPPQSARRTTINVSTA